MANIDSATALFEQLAATPWGQMPNAPSAFVMQSYGLQRLAAMEGEPGRAARVVEPLLGRGGSVTLP